MSDKDQFTFEDADDFSEALTGKKEESPKFDLGDDDDFPETDLSAAFSDGEHEAENPAPDLADEFEPDVAEEAAPKKAKGLFGLGKSGKPKKEKKPKKAKKEKAPKVKKEKKSGGGGSSSRILLLLLLLVVAGGAGAYFFMDLGGTTPSVPTVPAPAKKATKVVALPPKPAKVPAPAKTPAPAEAPVAAKAPAPAKPTPAVAKAPAPVQPPKPAEKAKSVTVAVPPPPKPAPVVKPQPAVAATEALQKTAAKPKPVPVKQPVAKAPVPAAKPAPVAQPKAVAVKPAVKATTPAKTVASVKQVADGAYALDAGSYLFEANRNALVAKIKKLGYEPLVTAIDARLDMTRLRLGTFSKTEVKEALAFARSIEPGSYSSPAGDGYVIYAGTFLKTTNVDKLKRRFLEEGIKARPEPVEVVRTLSRIRFGSFTSKEAAAAAAEASGKAGVKAVVIKSK